MANPKRPEVTETATPNKETVMAKPAKKTARRARKPSAARAKIDLETIDIGNAFHGVYVALVKDIALRERGHWYSKHTKEEARVWEIHDATRYEWHTNSSGKRVYDNGDNVAADLREMSLEDVYAFASRELRVATDVLRARYEHLNNGMQRMNLGNKIRKARKDKAA